MLNFIDERVSIHFYVVFFYYDNVKIVMMKICSSELGLHNDMRIQNVYAILADTKKLHKISTEQIVLMIFTLQTSIFKLLKMDEIELFTLYFLLEMSKKRRVTTWILCPSHLYST